MKRVLTALFLASFTPALQATPVTCLGQVIAHPKVVLIFWGPNFANAASPDFTYAQNLISYRNQLGSTHVWSTLTSYGVWPSNLGTGTADMFDTSQPPTAVTDAAVQSEVNKYLSTHTKDNSTIYEVVLPSTSYSSDGGSTSCGGPSLAYCTYNGRFGSGTTAVNYTVQPWASCAGCQVAGWTAAQNEEHMVESSTVDAATYGCHDSTGEGVADKCAWSPPPFLLNGFGYQYLWSNRVNACVQ